MNRQITIPEFLQFLPKDSRGYPIPFFVPIVDGKPNFLYADPNKLQVCFEKKLCGVCGRRLSKREYYYVGGPFTLRNGVSTDAPMHRRCAEFTLQTCPHLFFYRAERKGEGDPKQQEIHVDKKPEKIYLIRTEDLVWKQIEGHRLFKFRPSMFTSRYLYVDNKLRFDKKVATPEEIKANEPAIQEYIKSKS